MSVAAHEPVTLRLSSIARPFALELAEKSGLESAASSLRRGRGRAVELSREAAAKLRLAADAECQRTRNRSDDESSSAWSLANLVVRAIDTAA